MTKTDDCITRPEATIRRHGAMFRVDGCLKRGFGFTVLS